MSPRLFPLLALLGCPGAEPSPPSPLLTVEQTGGWQLDGLFQTVQVVRTAGGVAHVYAENDYDLARVHGFVMARDRFFMMDLARRFGLGEVSALLGDAALDVDVEARQTGMTWVSEHLVDHLTAHQASVLDAYADGVNQYIDQVAAGMVKAPSEYQVAYALLGAASPAELMEPFDRRSLAGLFGTLIYQLGYETGDVGQAANYLALDGLFDGAPLADLRNAGVYADVWEPIAPPWLVASAPDWVSGSEGKSKSHRTARLPHVPTELARRLATRLARSEHRRGRDHGSGWGSNAWAIMGSASADGRAVLAGDGHLPLTIPSFFAQIGLDTQHLGGGDIHTMGLVVPGMPMIAVGTNGHVAWSQTQLMGDITDWYVEELQLDTDGKPATSLFQGAEQALQEHVEVFDIRGVALLDSVERTERWSRFTTFDGRWIADIEGRAVTRDEALGAGEARVRLGDVFVVPGDTDGDGVITAISFDYTGLDDGNILRALDGFGRARTVAQVREATRYLVAYSQNIVAADADGSVLYTGYQAVPCRDHLARNADGTWADGADPSLLLDGTRFGGFTIPIEDGLPQERFHDDPQRCLVPFDAYPYAIDPAQGYVLTANNDPGGLSFDGSLTNDGYYIGGPWLEGYRAATIDEELAARVEEGTGSPATMQDLQGNHRSRLGAQLLPWLEEAIEAAEAAAAGSPAPGSAEERLATLLDANADRFDEAMTRLRAWSDGGFQAESGVDTFYDPGPTPAMQADAVATMIFTAWSGQYVRHVLDDEGFPGVYHPTGDTGRTRLLASMLEGRGPGNPLGLASWNPDTEESAFFDILDTTPIETSDEVALIALEAALDWLASEPTGTGVGGFGTDDMDAWLWGLRHRVRFDSILAEFLGDSDQFSALADPFSITPDVLPLAEGLASGDPRRGLDSFPRHSDHLNVDAANSGFRTDRFTFGSGPVFRMVIALGPDGPEGYNVVPGGQSGLTDSPYFADQAALWLANDTLPMQFAVDDVVAAAIGREVYTPKGVPSP